MQEMRLEGINQGYALPDPGLFLQPTNDATKATYFSTWLKLRSILLHRISRPQSNLEPLSNKMWRNLLSIEKTSPRPETQEGKLRAQVLDILNECALSAHSSLNFNDLSSVPVVWCGQQIQPQQIPPSSIVKQILWELYETNFRLEFLALDSILSKSNEPKEERQIRIDGQCWSNSLVIPDIEEAKPSAHDTDSDENELRMNVQTAGSEPVEAATGSTSMTERDAQNSHSETLNEEGDGGNDSETENGGDPAPRSACE